MKNRLADKTLGLSFASRIILDKLSDMDSDDLIQQNPEHDVCFVKCQTAAWYNGRERGIVLGYAHSNHTIGRHDWLFIVCVEGRSTDRIMIYDWRGALLINPQTLRDWPPTAYQGGRSFDEDDYDGVIETIRDLVRNHMLEISEVNPVIES